MDKRVGELVGSKQTQRYAYKKLHLAGKLNEKFQTKYFESIS